MVESCLRLICVLLFILVLAGCEDRTGRAESEQKLTQKLEEMQEELRLVLKEVIELHKKVDSITVSNKSGTSVSKKAKSVVMPVNERLAGSEDAKYAIIEFMDYQCPYCIRHAKQVLPTIKQRYIDTGKLRYGIRDFPLGFHSKAKGAAIAANCAGKQGKYWPIHDDLVINSRKLNDNLYLELAEKHNLEMDAFASCRTDPAMKKAVDDGLAYGTQVGTRGTPNFFIGKIDGDSIVDVVQLSGARSVEAFDRAIQQVMAAN